jgi:hypothetical protein
MSKHIVLEDPDHNLRPGMIVDAEHAHAYAGKGVILMPAMPELLVRGSICGFMQRFFGDGIELSEMPGPVCTLALLGVAELRTLNWAAKLAPTPELGAEIESGKGALGKLRVIGDSSQACFNLAGVSQTETSVADFGNVELLADGEILVRGKATLNLPSIGPVGFALYGHGRQLRLLWAAISQTE